VGRTLVIAGLVLVAVGLLVMLIGRLGLPLGKLPGDISYRGKNVTVFAPLGTCLLLSYCFRSWYGRSGTGDGNTSQRPPSLPHPLDQHRTGVLRVSDFSEEVDASTRPRCASS
jgi:hypothetical protein